MGDLKITMKPSITRRIISPTEFGRKFREAQDEVATEAELIFAAHALRSSGRMMRGIHAVPTKDGFDIETEAKNPQSGYDYVGVTRFGHRGMIVPRADRGPAAIVAFGSKGGRSAKRRAVGANAALRFVYQGRVIYRRSTKGFHPTGDWAAKAVPQVTREARRIMGKLARKIEGRA